MMILLAGLAVTNLLAGPVQSAVPVRGELVSAVKVATFTASQVDRYVADEYVEPPPSRYGVDAYRIVYRTIDPHGRPTTASGLVTLPVGAGPRLRLVSYTHGTVSNRDDVASMAEDDQSRVAALMFGAAGFAVAAPDYLGLGLGPGRHPYGLLASETTASADMLVATRDFAEDRRLSLDRRVLVTGFSQGGRVAVNLGKALQGGQVPHFRLGALAPIAGPFDLEHEEIPAGVAGRMDPAAANYYFGYLLTTWNRYVHLYDKPSEAFNAPYDESIEELFDGDHQFDDIIAALPHDSLQQLLTADMIDKLTHPTGGYARLLRSGDSACRGWSPDVPVRLYYGTADREVVPSNTTSCLSDFGGNRNVREVNLGPIGHFESWFVATPRILRWFEQLGS